MTRSEPQTFSARMDSLPLATGFVQAFCTQQDMAADDWKYVAKGTCMQMKGMTEAEAKMKTQKS